MMYLSIFSLLQNLFLQLFAVLVFTNVPNLIILVPNVRLQIRKSILLGV